MASSKKRTDAPDTKSGNGKSGPVKQIRVEDVSASIFSREHNGKTFHGISFTRSYKDSDGNYRYTSNFDPEDMGQLITVVKLTADWLREHQQ